MCFSSLVQCLIKHKICSWFSATTYHVHVKTGDVRSAGTDANVSLKIFGSKGDTDSLKLRNSEGGGNKFERGRTDLFKIETNDIGKVSFVLTFCMEVNDAGVIDYKENIVK